MQLAASSGKCAQLAARRGMRYLRQLAAAADGFFSTWQGPLPHTALLDDGQLAIEDKICRLEHGHQALRPITGYKSWQEEDHRARRGQAITKEEVSKVEILSHDDALLFIGKVQQVRIGRPRIRLGGVSNINASLAHGIDHSARATFIGENAHLLGSDRDVIGKIVCRKGERRQHIGQRQARILLCNLGKGQPAGALAHDLFDRHPCAADDGFALHDIGIGFDAFMNHTCNIACQGTPRYCLIPSEPSQMPDCDTCNLQTDEW